MDDNDNTIGLRLHRLDIEVKRALDAGMKNAGYDDVTLMHGWVLKYLYDIENAMSIKEISKGRSPLVVLP